MNITELESHIKEISVWKRGAQRAPHKPLLLLLAISKCLNEDCRLMPYAKVDVELKELLEEFGPIRKSYHTEYPFWRLQNDGIWELTNATNLESRKSNSDAKKSALLEHNVHGGLSEEVYKHIHNNRSLAIRVVNTILRNHFPDTLHEDILQAIKLDIKEQVERKKRDPSFRDRILTAYEHQCAVCGFNVRVGNSLVGLEAAHIKWHQAGGPNTESNGLALCSLHHKLFDRGAFSVDDKRQVIVSNLTNGTNGLSEWLTSFNGKKLNEPQNTDFFPETDFTYWHFNQVFQGQGRETRRRVI